MLKGLKVSSLVCKCVFSGPEQNAKGRHREGYRSLNFEGLELQK